MLDAKRIESNLKPKTVEPLGNGIYYYNYDVQEYTVQTVDERTEEMKEETRWSYIQVRINGKPNYNKCALAIIRAYIDANEEFDLMNSFNAYQLGITDSVGEDYEEYLQLVKEIKANVGKDFNKQESKSAKISTAPRQADITRLMLMTINTMALDDQQALEVKSLYPSWESFIGKQLEKDMKVQYDGKLFKVVQTHTAQQDWYPSISTASLFTEIVEDHAGTLEDPIPYPADGNMVIYNGKYYIDNGVIYKCVRDSGIPLYTSLANVVGNYVQLA